MVNTLNRIVRLYSVPAVIFATMLFVAAVSFGLTRDFGAFLVSIVALPLMLLASLAATVWAICIKAQRRRALAAVALICLAPLAYVGAGKAQDHVRFFLWAPWHVTELVGTMGKDQILQGWDSWGFAGEDTYSYLAIDTQDRLGQRVRADQWVKELGQTCQVAGAQRMLPKLYVVTTYTDCPFDKVAPAAG